MTRIISPMDINTIGMVAATATFLGVWIGHVSVRKIERHVERIWIPAMLAFILGLGLELASFGVDSSALSAVCGIIGITLLFDSLELSVRQPRRIKKGHAPANPNNPRHARIMATHPDATTIDWLHREPRGRPFTKNELELIKEETK